MTGGALFSGIGPALAGLFDDAAIFPPGNAAVEVALKAHLARRATPDGRFVGPLICDVERLPQLLDHVRRPLAVSLVGTPAEITTAQAFVVLSPLRVVGVEVRPTGSQEAPLPDFPVRLTAVERPWAAAGCAADLDPDAAYGVPAGAVLKLRCGGDVVPTVEQVAAAMSWCVAHHQPFKLTAGLHRALASTGAAGQAHGFVNVMAAVVAALDGLDPAPVLAASTPDELAAAGADLDRLAESRRLLRSIGTCSIDEPLDDLRALGWLA